MIDDDLSRVLETCHDSTLYLRAFTSALKDLDDPACANPHARFLELCDIVDLAFFQGQSSPEEMQSNPLTAPLASYALRALRLYRSRALLKAELKGNVATRERGAILLEAFGAKGDQGGSRRSRRWDVARKTQLLSAFTAAVEEQLASHRHAADTEAVKLEKERLAYVKGYEAAYDEAFGADTLKGRADREVKKNDRRLLKLLHAHGYAVRVIEAYAKDSSSRFKWL